MAGSSPFRLSLLREVAGFGSVVARIGGRRAWTALIFLILGSLTEGISILLLVPLLHLVGRPDQNFAIRLPDNDMVRWLVPDGTLQLTTVLCMLVGLVTLQAAFNRFRSVYMAGLLLDFINRLRMPTFTPKLLQTDPTIIYGCTVATQKSAACQKWDGRIHRIHLDDKDNPYNTYTHEGLPPGPISNPTRSTTSAAAESSTRTATARSSWSRPPRSGSAG